MANSLKAADTDKQSKSRRRALFIVAIILTSSLGGVLAATNDIALHAGRDIDLFRVITFVILSVGLLLFVLTGGRLAFINPALNDELVRANRAKALRFGYIMLVLATIVIYVAMLITPVDFTQIIPVLVMVGVALPAIYFAALEQRGER